MRILIVEDQEYKLDKISKAINAVFGVDVDVEIDKCNNLSTAKKHIENRQYDFLILDLGFPLFNSEIYTRERPEKDAGITLLDYMELKDISIKTVVVSAIENLKEFLTERGYPDMPYVEFRAGRSLTEPLREEINKYN